MSNVKSLDELVEEALGNIRNDRKVAREFLNEVANQIAKEPEQNKYLSPVAAKHIETLQRSNEQLVKLINKLLLIISYQGILIFLIYCLEKMKLLQLKKLYWKMIITKFLFLYPLGNYRGLFEYFQILVDL